MRSGHACTGEHLMDKSTEEWTVKRTDHPYEIDGVVFKLDDLAGRGNWA